MSQQAQMIRSPRTFYLISEVNAAVRTRMEQALREFDLTVRQYTVMSRLKGHEVLSAASLARHHHVSPQTMSEMINGLEASLVCREVQERNRRQMLVSLTQAGLDILVECDRKVDSLEPEFFYDINSADHGTLRKLLEIILTAAHRTERN